MHKHIIAAIVVRNESETLIGIKPFYCATIHYSNLQKLILQNIKTNLTSFAKHQY